MENKLQIFEYQNKPVRTVDCADGVWWVLKDVCTALEIVNHKNVKARLDEDEKGVYLVDTLGGMQQTTIINEPGLYSVILRSDKPEAKAFKRWVTHEVLPNIRKTGSYGKPDTELITQVATATATAVMQQLLPLLRTSRAQEADFDTEYIQLQETRRRPNRSSSVISQLDAGLRQEVEEMLCSRKFSYTDVVEMLREQGIKISTSSVCNYAKKHNIRPV